MRKIYIFFPIAIASLFLFSKLSKANNGYCESKGVYLSDDEKITSALIYTLQSYPPVLDEHVKNEKENKLILFRPKKFITYNSVSDFKKHNANCCMVVDHDKSGEKIPIFSRLMGDISSYVKVSYVFRYTDEDGKIEARNIENYIAISNCGHSWSGI